jgi:hypothetical protein
MVGVEYADISPVSPTLKTEKKYKKPAFKDNINDIVEKLKAQYKGKEIGAISAEMKRSEWRGDFTTAEAATAAAGDGGLVKRGRYIQYSGTKAMYTINKKGKKVPVVGTYYRAFSAAFARQYTQLVAVRKGIEIKSRNDQPRGTDLVLDKKGRIRARKVFLKTDIRKYVQQYNNKYGRLSGPVKVMLPFALVRRKYVYKLYRDDVNKHDVIFVRAGKTIAVRLHFSADERTTYMRNYENMKAKMVARGFTPARGEAIRATAEKIRTSFIGWVKVPIAASVSGTHMSQIDQPGIQFAPTAIRDKVKSKRDFWVRMYRSADGGAYTMFRMKMEIVKNVKFRAAPGAAEQTKVMTKIRKHLAIVPLFNIGEDLDYIPMPVDRSAPFVTLRGRVPAGMPAIDYRA